MNDIFLPIRTACVGGLSPSCVNVIQSELAAYSADLKQTLKTLRKAAGGHTRIVIGTYDNPIVGTCPLAAVPGATQLGAGSLEGFGFPPLQKGLHDIMRDVAADHGVEVAEVYGQLDSTTGSVDCQHPDDSGYQKVKDAFLRVLTGG